MTQHTLGKWFVLSSESGRRIISNTVGAHWAKKGRYVGEVTANNASLIATAPYLLAEAKELLRNARYADGIAQCLTQDCEALEVAIAQAENRPTTPHNDK